MFCLCSYYSYNTSSNIYINDFLSKISRWNCYLFVDSQNIYLPSISVTDNLLPDIHIDIKSALFYTRNFGISVSCKLEKQSLQDATPTL